MTKSETDLMKRLFPDGENHTGYFSLAIKHTLPSPFTIPNPIFIAGFDLTAENAIRECEEAAAALKVYRKALSERKAWLSVTPFVSVVRLDRKRHPYDGKIYYHLDTFRRLTESGGEIPENSQKFPGGQWRKARAAFLAYVKEHPDAVAENLVSAG